MVSGTSGTAAADGSDGGAPDLPELRLALALRGGVSLAIWMGGACAEIDALRRASVGVDGTSDGADATDDAGDDDPGVAFWREVLAASPYSRVVVDVMAGASAGGVNGVVFASAIRHGFPMADLRAVWGRVADAGRLRRTTEPWESVFDGDRAFLDELHDQLVALTTTPTAGHSTAEGPHVDLQLTATLVEPVTRPAISPTDEAIRRPRFEARFHVRHDPRAVFARRDLDLGGLAGLALAARSSASFPVAFEGAVVRSSRPATFELGPIDVGAPPPADARPGWHRSVDCRGLFSERRGSSTGRDEGLHRDDFVVADGGLVDNIPIGKALDAIRRSPASGPTRRVLVYLHPTGPPEPGDEVPPAGSDDAAAEVARRGPFAVLRGAAATRFQGQSIDTDLERIEAANRNLRLRREARRAAAAEHPPDYDDPHDLKHRVDRADYVGRALERRTAYLEQRAAIDAESIRSLLHDPLTVLGDDPFPTAPPPRDLARPPIDPDDRWRAPLALWSVEQRLDLDRALRACFGGRLKQRFDAEPDQPDRQALRRLLLGGLGPLARTVDLLVELAIATEARTDLTDDERGALGRAKADLYRLGSLVDELERIRRIGWVASAGTLERDQSVVTWVIATLDALNQVLGCPRSEALALCSGVEAADVGAVVEAQTSFLARCNDRLQTLATDGPPAPTDVAADTRGWDDLREVVVLSLGFVADSILAVGDRHEGGGQPVDDGIDLLHRVLRPRADGTRVVPPARPADPTPFDYGIRFAALEVLLVREHLLGPSAGVEVAFTRMSAAAPTIDAQRYHRLHQASRTCAPDDVDHLSPQAKLAGTEVHNFGAFLDERWRANDWLWGRMDAVPTLVDLLLGVDHPAGTDAAAFRRRLIRARQDQVFAEAALAAAPHQPVEETRQTWSVGLETLTVPGSEQRSEEVVALADAAARVVGAVVPPRFPRVTGPLQGAARLVARRVSRPRGRTDRTDAPTHAAAVDRAWPWWRRRIAAVVVPVLGLVVAALVWGLARDPASLVAGLVAGVVVTLVPGAFLVWLGVFRDRPPSHRSRWWWLVVPMVAVVAVLATVVVAALR